MRRYDMSFKIDAVKLASEVGSTKASKELGIPQGTLDTWVSKDKKGELEKGNLCPRRALNLADEVNRLQQENRELKRTNDILRKASAFFASSQKK
jgi:transposase